MSDNATEHLVTAASECRHSWRFDGDDPYVTCVYCDRMEDALTGRVIREGNEQ